MFFRPLRRTRFEAAKWFCAVQTCEDFEELWPALDAWLEASSSHRRAYSDIQHEWLMLHVALEHHPRLRMDGVRRVIEVPHFPPGVDWKRLGILILALPIITVVLATTPLWRSR